jgi:protein-S-isoprenylcysteine O-methyltransferase Ste14
MSEREPREPRAASTSTSSIALRAIFYASAFVALWTFVALSLRRLDPRLGGVLPSWLVPIGWCLALAGAVVAATSIVLFVKDGRGTPALFDSPREFVASGPYRFVRNPMYIGGLGVLLGTGFVLRSPTIALLSLAFAALAHAIVVGHEEPRLERLFGESYLAYRRSVSRWVPGAPPRRKLAHMRH